MSMRVLGCHWPYFLPAHSILGAAWVLQHPGGFYAPIIEHPFFLVKTFFSSRSPVFSTMVFKVDLRSLDSGLKWALNGVDGCAIITTEVVLWHLFHAAR